MPRKVVFIFCLHLYFSLSNLWLSQKAYFSLAWALVVQSDRTGAS